MTDQPTPGPAVPATAPPRPGGGAPGEPAFRPETRAAADAVRAGLALARAGTGAVRAKPGRPRDVVTDADEAVEDLVRDLLGRAGVAAGGVAAAGVGSGRVGIGGAPVVGEERGGEPVGAGPYWLVDPICGTRNFASGVPLFAVNVALVEDGELTVAAVGDGSTGQVLVAERGRGAHVLAPEGARRLQAGADSDVVVIGSWPLAPARRGEAAEVLATLVRQNRLDIRVLASTVGLAYVAAGRFAADLYFGAAPLHYGAGALLASEAGAVVSDLDGRPFGVASTSLVAAGSAELHATLLALVAAVTGGGPW